MGDISQGTETHALEGPRPARLEERDALLEMINFVFRVSRGWEPTIATDWPHVYAPENLSNVMVLCDPKRDAAVQPESASVAGQLVASTGVWTSDVVLGAHSLRVGGINCVGTLPEYRGRGLGAQVMEAAQQIMRDLGCHVGLLSTGISNWYRRLGWESVGVIRRYALNRGNIGLLPELRAGLRARSVALGEQVHSEPFDQALAAELLQLFAAARLGATRSAAGWQQLIAAHRIDRLLVAEEAGQPVAYLLLRGPSVMEWAGAAADVLGLVRAAFEMLDDRSLSTSRRGRDGNAPSLRSLTLQTPGADAAGLHPLVTWLDGRGFPCHSDYLGMLYVVDPRGVLAAFGVDDVEINMQHADDGRELFAVTFGGETLSLDRPQLVKLLFGPERVINGAHSPFPLPFWQWPLEMV